MNGEQKQNESPKIFAAMSAVMSAIGAIGKDQQNQIQKYKFRGIDDVYNAVYDAMCEQKVFNVPCVLERTETQGMTKNGSVNFRVVNKMEFTFYAEDGSSITIGPVYGEAMDTSDKATNKANSMCHKAALIMAFCIPTKENDEADRDHFEMKSENRSQQQTRQSPPAQNKNQNQSKPGPAAKSSHSQPQTNTRPSSNDSNTPPKSNFGPNRNTRPATKQAPRDQEPHPDAKIDQRDAAGLKSIAGANGWKVSQVTALIKNWAKKTLWSELTYGELDFIVDYIQKNSPDDQEEPSES